MAEFATFPYASMCVDECVWISIAAVRYTICICSANPTVYICVVLWGGLNWLPLIHLSSPL